jgi:isopentenyl-diphosphate delta-isomerase
MESQVENNVILVDIQDEPQGVMEKMEAHRKAFLHRAVSVFVFNTKGEWLLQRRASDKYHSGGLWTNSCCTHPFPGESNAQAASRRLQQEMGLDVPLTEIFEFVYKEKLDNDLTEHEYDHVFVGVSDMQPSVNTDEVMEYRYINYLDLKTEVQHSPERFTYWFMKIMDQVFHTFNEKL